MKLGAVWFKKIHATTLCLNMHNLNVVRFLLMIPVFLEKALNFVWRVRLSGSAEINKVLEFGSALNQNGHMRWTWWWW